MKKELIRITKEALPVLIAMSFCFVILMGIITALQNEFKISTELTTFIIVIILVKMIII